MSSVLENSDCAENEGDADISFKQYSNFEKSMKNINHSFNNISIQNEEAIKLQCDLESQFTLSSTHCVEVICKGNSKIYNESFLIVKTQLEPLSSNDISVQEFEAIKNDI